MLQSVMRTRKKCDSLSEVRQEIDRIDEALLLLLAERCAYVRQVVDFKGREDIIDEKRIEAIIRKQRHVAESLEMDGETVTAIWRMMIEQCIAMEEQLFEQKDGAE